MSQVINPIVAVFPRSVGTDESDGMPLIGGGGDGEGMDAGPVPPQAVSNTIDKIDVNLVNVDDDNIHMDIS